MTKNLLPNPTSYMMKNLFLAIACQIISLAAFAQQKIKGTVTDGQLKLAGASVTLKTKGKQPITVVTNNQGQYTIEVPSPEAVLLFNYIGMMPKEVQVGNRNIIDVELSYVAQRLQDVVMVGYGLESRMKISSAISKVTANSLTPDKNVTSDIGKALQGRVPGLFIASTEGSPNSSKTIQIRGVQTALAVSSNPLIVLDGLIIDNNTFNINAINPQDIESVEVLKDAASAAIYGARGSTGVIIITTKKGGANSKTNFSVNSYYGLNNVYTGHEVLGTSDYKTAFTDARQNRINDIGTQLAAGGLTAAQIAQLNTEKNSLTNTINNLSLANRSTNWVDRIKNKNAPVNNLQVNMEGGSDKTQYYLSIGHYGEAAGMGTGNFDRYTGRMNLVQKINNWLRISSQMSYTRNVSKGYTYPLVPALQARPDTPDDPVYNSNGSPGYYVGFQQHPLAVMLDNNNIANDNNLLGSVSADITFNKNLSFRSQVSGDKADRNSYSYSSPFTYSGAPNGLGSTKVSETFFYNIDNYFTYNGHWKKLGATATLGQSFYSYKQSQYGFDLTGFPAAVGIYGAGAASAYGSPSNIPFNNSTAQEYSESYFLRGNLDWEGKYLLGASIRTDGTSKLVATNRFSWFPAVSAGWIISRENFFKPVTFISNLKLRASYGQTGNIRPVGLFDAQNLLAAGSYLGTSSLLISAVSGNSALKWENTTQYDAGLDVSVLKNRLSVTFDVYKKRTDGLLTANFTPMSSGFNSKRDNIGSIQNTGFDVEVNYTSDKSRRFHWDVSANIGVNRNKVLSLRDSVMSYGTFIFGGPQSQIRVGQSVGSVSVLQSLGVDPKTGDMMYQDQNKDGIINSKDYVNVPIALPQFNGGFNINLYYKGFDMNGLFVFVYGNKIYDYYEQTMSDYNTDFFGVMPNKFDAVKARWRNPGDVTDVPRAIVGVHGPQLTSNWNVQPSTRFIYDASYLRLRNLSVGYELPKRVVSKINVSKARVYLAAQNVFTITKYVGFDPETVSNSGIVSSNVPQSRSMVFGIDFSF